ncbi:tetratricopeptide repeat protein [Rhizobium sp. CRIBSB]|nr:tetratricopeptide repeat protein [Rhizobium sp. CRIBSB]
MVDVFEQVEEELRSDRYKRLARTWLPVVGAVLGVALVAALGWWGWDSWQSSRANAASSAYDRGMEALQANNAAGAEAAFSEAAEKGNGAYRALALMQRAGLAVTDNRIPQAVELFDEAAKASGDPILADIASLKAVYLLMDTATLADIEARLEPLIKEGRPYRAFATEAQAMARLQNGQTAQAREALVLLQLGQDVPDPIRERAQGAIDQIDSGSAANLQSISRAQAALPAPAPAPQGPVQVPTQ